MSQPSFTYIGLDISKKKIDIWSASTGKKIISNDDAGIQKLVTLTKRLETPFVVCEPTSHYHIPVVRKMQELGIAVSTLSPRKVRNFARAQGLLEKTDAIDAKVIAEFGRVMEVVTPDPLPKPGFDELHLLQVRVRQLTQMIAMEKTHLEGFSTNAYREVVLKHIQGLQEDLRLLESEMDKLIHQDEEIQERVDILKSAPGVGPKTARLLVSLLPELGSFSNRSLSKLVGVAPLNRDSGRLQGKRSIFGGRIEVRCGLYMATIVAIKHNPRIKAFYDQLKTRGKGAKVAIVACMRKFLTILNSMVKTKTYFFLKEQKMS